MPAQDDGETVQLKVEAVKRESEKAILVVIEGAEYWVPKSQIHDDSECYSVKSGPGTLIISQWLARQKGLA